MHHDAKQLSICTRRSLSRIAYLSSGLPGDLAEKLWHDPSAILASGEPLQSSHLRSTVRITWGTQQFVMKHYRPNLWQTVLQLAKPSRAWATCSTTIRLADGGVATPRPAACIENCLGPLRRDSFLVYPYQAGRTLRSYFKNEAKQSKSLADSLWQQLHELWHTLEKLQASLEDTNTGNFIICPAGRLWVIDLDKARFHRQPNAAAKHQQLGWQRLLRSAAKC